MRARLAEGSQHTRLDIPTCAGYDSDQGDSFLCDRVVAWFVLAGGERGGKAVAGENGVGRAHRDCHTAFAEALGKGKHLDARVVELGERARCLGRRPVHV